MAVHVKEIDDDSVGPSETQLNVVLPASARKADNGSVVLLEHSVTRLIKYSKVFKVYLPQNEMS